MTNVPGLNESSTGWSNRIIQLYRCVDRKDVDGFLAFLHPTAAVTFGNSPSMVGNAAIKAGLTKFLSSVGSISHEILNCWALDATVICELRVSYRRHDGRCVAVPSANVLQVDDKLIRDYRVYRDPEPLLRP